MNQVTTGRSFFTDHAVELAKQVEAGNVRAVARVISLLENGDPTGAAVLTHFVPSVNRAFVIGITGYPGTGKSTLIDQLIIAYRRLGQKVGVLAVDISSPVTGGAVLGDRIRMQRHTDDPQVYIRSMATRGQQGGLAAATRQALRVLDAAAYGANAMFGVINIVTRHAGDTHGAALSVTRGEGDIEDNSARVGWGNERASFRLSAGRRGDSGYLNVHDDKRFSQLHFRGDLRPDNDNEFMLSAGVVEHAAGEGFPGGISNALRTIGTVGSGASRNAFSTAERIVKYSMYEGTTRKPTIATMASTAATNRNPIIDSPRSDRIDPAITPPLTGCRCRPA